MKKIFIIRGGICIPFGIREKDILYRYVFYLRHVELYHNTGKKLRKLFWGIFLKRIEMKYALHIGINVCDEGLSIAHVGPIVINSDCRIGKNLRIHVGVNIGANAVVNKTCIEKDKHLVGVPAHIV